MPVARSQSGRKLLDDLLGVEHEAHAARQRRLDVALAVLGEVDAEEPVEGDRLPEVGSDDPDRVQLGHTATLAPSAILAAVLAPHPARHLLRAKDLVDARYREPLDVKTLACAAKLSPAHFSREFRREFGESPHQYLLMRRLERAASLLRTTDRSVADICLTVGSAQRRLVHDELPPQVRHDADGVPRRPSAGRASRPHPDLRAARVGPPGDSTFGEDSRIAPDYGGLRIVRRQEDTMLKQLTHVNQWVHDQDEALAFYTEKLGLELRDDVTVPELGNFRWLTVGVPGQPEVSITLMAVPGPPVFDAETQAQLQALVAKGAAGGLFFQTDDVRGRTRSSRRAAWSSRRSRPSSPTASMPDFRDQSGNQIRMMQQ